MRNDKFASPDEIKRVLKNINNAQGGGPLLWMDPETKDAYLLDSESNNIFLGVSGAGKTTAGILSMILTFIKFLECFIVFDPKGDLFYYTYCFAKKAGYDLKILNFREKEFSTAVNILEEPYQLFRSGDKDAAHDSIETISHCIIKHGKENDPFWVDSARSLLEAAIHILLERGTPEEINIQSIYNILSTGTMRFGPKTYFDYFCNENPDSIYTKLLSTVRSAPHDTLGSILSSTFQPLNSFIGSPAFVDMISSNEFAISDLDVEKPTAVYIITPDENTNYSAITGILVNQIMNHYIRLAHTKYNGRLKRRVNLCIEELGNLGEGTIPNLDHLMSAGRSRNIRTSIVLQAFSQLDQNFGKSVSETITSNADTIIAYRTNNWNTLEELSRKCGEKQINYGTHVNTERLITPSQLAAMETRRALVMIGGRYKYSTVLPFFSEVFPMDEWNPPTLTKRIRKPIVTFDFEAAVKEMSESHKPEKQDITFPNPFSSSSPFPLSKETKQPKPLDIEAMMKDIDKKLKSLSLEESEKKSFVNKNKVGMNSTFIELYIKLECIDHRDDIIDLINTYRNEPISSDSSDNVSIYFTSYTEAIRVAKRLKKLDVPCRCNVWLGYEESGGDNNE